MRRFRTPLTTLLLVSITLVFALEWIRGGTQENAVLYRMGAIHPDLFQDGEYWRLFAAMFLHAGVLHVALNLWALFQIGTIFESMFGPGRFALTYLLSGLAASIASAVLPPHGLSVGASGAIFGIIGALILAIRRSPHWRNQPWAKGLTQQLLFWAGANIVIGFTIPRIDNAAHLGGFIMGLLLGLVPHRVPPPPPGQETIDAVVTEQSSAAV
ncbi:MAG TPA: rhomboid family intramembrane serine protease [Thermoanaerobaculia bacterium]|nr:rhomboid family intramembrane serine protease [Thermoanaerobaculia bacterium]